MRQSIVLSLCVAGAVTLSACSETSDNTVDRKLQDVNVVDETNLNDVMLSAADPAEAVNYFQRALSQNPDRIDLMRGLAASQVRAKRMPEAVAAWRRVADHPDAADSDRVELADALIRANDWPAAEKVLDAIPPTFETYKRYRLEAMIADGNQEWDKADSFYETAIGLTAEPGSVLNNWGYSKLTRGDFPAAEQLFTQAIQRDRNNFTAKNNLVLARGAQGNYVLPVVPMDQTERAQLLHTMGLAAVKRGDVTTGRGLFREAIETHPQHFEAAARSLSALENNITN